ncbi:MAG TPA: DedA family protein [Blastocatellia bacterium]|nr:DedA family protein [Blastocatellia bacterium]
MIAKIIEFLSGIIVAVISSLGYAGVVLLMAIESACIPLPSEIIMPFSGYLVYTGRFNLWGVGVAGALGCVLGSIVAYYIGLYGGRPLIEKYGRYILVSHHDLDLADRWFQKYGEIIVFASRLLPVVRTFIAFPAGVARMNMSRFILYTFLGSLPWCLGLAYVGQKLGEQWDKNETLKAWFHRFDFVIGILLVAGAAWWVWRHLKNARSTTAVEKAKETESARH